MASPLGFVSYSIANDKAFDAKLKEARQVTNNLRIPLEQISIDFYISQQAIFRLKSAGQYPDFKGKRSPKTGLTAYQSFKKKKYKFIYPLLKAKGKLEASVTGPKNPGSIFEITNTDITIGTSVKYGKYHQQDSGKGSKMPLRKFLFIGPESSPVADSPKGKFSTRGRLDRWNKIMDRYIRGKLGKTFEQRVRL